MSGSDDTTRDDTTRVDATGVDATGDDTAGDDTAHDALLVDLDGTVYRGPDPVDHAIEALEAVRRRGVAISYVTNNASRSPAHVRDHLAGLGLTLAEDDVVTSAQAGAALLADRCPPGSAVLVLGTDALADEVRLVGLSPVRTADEDPVAVVQGHSPDTGWNELAEATMAIGRGAAWIACNVDPTLPSDRGLLPGNGAMVAALRTASDREPDIAGKPASPLLQQAVERVGAARPLVIGDRLDTDVAGGRAIGADTLLVLTGVSTAADVLGAAADLRPTYLSADLSILADGADLETVRLGVDGEWTVEAGADGLRLAGGDEQGDPAAALRALCTVAWEAAGDDAPHADALVVRPDGKAAEAAVDALGLSRA